MNTNIRLIALFLVFASLGTMALGIIPKASAGGPPTGNMLIKIYLDPSQEESALAKGDIDINDWPLSSTFINTNFNNPAITMNSYAEIGEYEFDINNQWWPTGPNDPTHTTVTARNIFFNPTGVRDIAALHFRRAIAHLSNKAKYTTDYMGGYGYIMQTPIPVPAMETFTDYSTLSNSTAQADPYGSTGGYLYTYDRAAAAREFDLGGFRFWTDSPNPSVRSWRDPGPDGVYGGGPSGNVKDADDGAVETLPNMKFWIRLDDPNRRLAGVDLYNEMVAAGIPAAAGTGLPGLDERIAERSTEFTEVMVLYDYNIYTGGWSVTADPDFLYDFFHSSMGQYSYANNYAGFKNAEYDAYAVKVKFPASLTAPSIEPGVTQFEFDCIQAQWVWSKYMPVVELWCAKGVKGYRTGWTGPSGIGTTGAVNYAGAGTDNGYSFMLMSWNPTQSYMTRTGPANTVVYGFKSDISALQVLTSEWLWDWNVLGQIYDTLLARNPYNLPEVIGTLATAWNDSTTYPGWEGKTVTQFTVRSDATFHNGAPVTPADVAYSLLCVRDAGAGNAWNYATVFEIDHVQIQGQIIRIFWTVKSALALHWAGFMPIIDEDLWNQASAIGPGTASGYTGYIPHNTNGNFGGGGGPVGTYVNAAHIRDFHPWETTDPATGKYYLSEDGSWGWSFVNYVVGQTVSLSAYSGMYTTVYRSTGSFTPMTFSQFIASAFHDVGDVNWPGTTNPAWYSKLDSLIDTYDLGLIANALSISSASTPWGSKFNQYNPDADLDSNGIVNIFDMSIASVHFGLTPG